MEKLSTNHGFVKLPRSILDWEWYDHPDVSRVYLHILLKVNYKPMNWRGISIGIGEHITSIEKLSTSLSLSKHKTRESLIKLSETGFIKVEPTNQFTKVIVLNLDDYGLVEGHSQKPIEHQNSSQNTNSSKTTQNQTKTNKKEEEIEERKEFFKNEILKFSNSFSKVHLEGFYEYWSIENKQTGRLKFEEEFKWNIEMKITSWKDFSKKTEKKKLTTNRP